MAAHHYVPRFVLKRWATGGLLHAYSWHAKANRSVPNRPSLDQACSLDELNTLRTVAPGNRYDAEASFTRIDTPAARALAVMLDEGVSALTLANRQAWANFINSVPVRMPETLLHLGPDAFRRAIAHHEKGDAPGASRSYVREQFLERMALHALDAPIRAAMGLSARQDNIDLIAGMTWWTRRFESGCLLIGDRPLLTEPRMPWPCGIPIDNPKAVLAFPLSPDIIWYASSDVKARTMSRRQTSPVALHLANRETIRRNSVHVFAKSPTRDFRAWVMGEVAKRGKTPPLPAYPPLDPA